MAEVHRINKWLYLTRMNYTKTEPYTLIVLEDAPETQVFYAKGFENLGICPVVYESSCGPIRRK